MDDEKEFNSSLKLVAKSSVIVFVALVFSKIFTYVYRIIIARQFGPEVYGLFSLAIMLSGWIIVIAIFGLNEGVLRYTSIFRGKKEVGKIRYIFKRSLKLLFFTGISGGILLFVLSKFIAEGIFGEPNLTIFLMIFSFVIPIHVMLTIFLASLRAYEKIGWRVFLSFVLETGLQVGLIILFIVIGFGIISVPLSYVLSSLVVFILAVIVLRKKVPTIFKKSEIKNGAKIFGEVLSYSWPLIFATIIWRVFKWTDSFFIGFFRTAAEVGFYNAAVPIAFLLTFSSALFMQMFSPLINKEYSKKNNETVKQLSQQVGKWIFFINLPVFFIIILFPETIMNILFGGEFIVAADALRILAVGMVFASLSDVPIRILYMVGKSKIILFDIAGVAIINFVLNIFLVPRYGINGAAISTSFSFVILGFLFLFQAYKETKILPIRRKNLNILVAAIISLGLLLWIRSLVLINSISLIFLGVFFFVFYTLLVLIFRGFDKNDFMIFKSITGKIRGGN